MGSVYTASVIVRHHELDRFGRLHPAVYLRYLAHAAVEASTAAGYDAAWYAAARSLWLVRRSTFEVVRPVVAGEQLAIRTWVEDFRRVRSHRRYEVSGHDGPLCLDARTDWVYVDAVSGRPQRVPAELEAAFHTLRGRAQERNGLRAPAPPAVPARTSHRVAVYELDALGHMNNAVYLDLLGQATLDALGDAGWPLERLIASGRVPVLARGDLEYLEAARYDDQLEIATWFTPARDALDAHQLISRRGEERPLVRASTRWRWTDPSASASLDMPHDLLPALESVLAVRESA